MSKPMAASADAGEEYWASGGAVEDAVDLPDTRDAAAEAGPQHASETWAEPLVHGDESTPLTDRRSHGAFERDEWGGEQGRLFLHGNKTVLRGRTLELILWLAANQERINAARCESGQLWLTWKGFAGASIMGRILVRL